MAAAFCDKLMAYDVEPEEWRKLDVRVGEPAAGDFCDEPQGPRGDDLRHGLPGAARRAGFRPGPDGSALQ